MADRSSFDCIRLVFIYFIYLFILLQFMAILAEKKKEKENMVP